VPLIPETITVTVPGEPDTENPDAMGNPTLGPDVATQLVVKAFAPRQSEEGAEEYGGVAISGGVVYGYAGTSIPPNAILTIRGDDYLMEGETGDFRATYSSAVELGVEGVQFSVKRAT
jgi:hypothetical protein